MAVGRARTAAGVKTMFRVVSVCSSMYLASFTTTATTTETLQSDTQHTQIQTESAKVPRAGHFYPLIHPPTRTYPSSHPLTYPSAHSAHPPTDRKHPSQSKPSELTPGFGSWLRVRLEFSINALPVLKATDSIRPAAYIGHHSLAKLQTGGSDYLLF